MIGEKISGEEETGFGLQKTAVARGVAGEGDHFESVNSFPWLEPMIDFRRFEAEKESPHLLKPAGNLGPATILVAAHHVVAIGPWGINPALGEFFKFGDVESVVEMSVGQENTPNIRQGFAMLAKCLLDPIDPAHKSAVNQINPVVTNDEVVLHDESAQWNDLRHEARISDFMKKPTMDAF